MAGMAGAWVSTGASSIRIPPGLCKSFRYEWTVDRCRHFSVLDRHKTSTKRGRNENISDVEVALGFVLRHCGVGLEIHDVLCAIDN